MTIIQSEHNRTFGGFVNVKFDSTSQYYPDPDAFLFSITDQKKFEIKLRGYAFYTLPNARIASFGGGHDIYIPNNANINKDSS